MDASNNSRSLKVRLRPWSAEALLATGLVAGCVSARSRNPSLTMVLALGALAWRVLLPQPKRRVAPPRVVLPEARREIQGFERPWAVTAWTEPPLHVEHCEPIKPPGACAVVDACEPEQPLEFPSAPELPAFKMRDISETMFRDSATVSALYAEPNDLVTGDAWMLGLEPLPVVMELSEMPMVSAVLPESEPSDLMEHRPAIAEGAPLPDIIEINIEPSMEGLAVVKSMIESMATPVNDEPVHLTAEPTVAAPEIVESSVETELETLSELLSAAPMLREPAESESWRAMEDTVSLLHRPMADSFLHEPADIPEPEPVEVAMAEDDIAFTRPPASRLMARITSPSFVRPRNVEMSERESFGFASVNEAPTAVMKASRRIVPRAPGALPHIHAQQKSWLNWWK